jgi:hypothetical protein
MKTGYAKSVISVAVLAPLVAAMTASAQVMPPQITTPDRVESRLGRFEKGLEEANAKGWTVVDMKRDWKTIYAFEKK